MGKRKAALARRAWKLLRLALFWARKGGVIVRGMLPDLRRVSNYIKSLRAARSDMVHFGDREFSFDETTPVFYFKMSRPRSARMLHIPCINPPVDLDDDDDVLLFDRDRRTSCLRRRNADDEEEDAEEGVGLEDLVDGGAGDELAHQVSRAVEGDDEDGEKCIDVKAEEFITKFYEQMKLQRQISLLQYNEMLLRSTN